MRPPGVIISPRAFLKYGWCPHTFYSTLHTDTLQISGPTVVAGLKKYKNICDDGRGNWLFNLLQHNFQRKILSIIGL